MYELIITEKPASAKKLAEALDNGKPVKESIKGAPYYRVTHGKKDIIVGCAVGHLFGLAEKEKKGFRYPVFDVHWAPLYETNKNAAFSKKYFDALKKLAKDAEAVTVACDYDVEGEVIGLNVIRFICKRKDARRMKFSTLTKQDLVNAYETAEPHIDWEQAEAGETRHYLDFFYGINLSRALTTAIKKAGMFKILSTGRVQGPALKIIVERERDIKAFKPVQYWQIELHGITHGAVIEAWHITEKFWDEKVAKRTHAEVRSAKTATVTNVETQKFKQKSPTPFDLTTLQSESYRLFGIKPKIVLDIAQKLYTSGHISYPRTSSQQLPKSIGYTSIIKALGKQKTYAKLAKMLLARKELTPNNGKKTDPAHPAIYPTGVAPRGLEGRNEKVYDLIVKRFFATFCEHAVRETVTVTLDANNEPFLTKGTRTIEKNWHEFYQPYVKLEEAELPAVAKGDGIDIKKIVLHAKETQPPKRYSPSSIVRELEKRNLGTKATRADIVERLYTRNYVKGDAIEATDLGIHLINVLEKYSPKIVDEALTSHFELDMEAIRENKKNRESVLAEAREVLIDMLAEFKEKDKEVGEGLKTTFMETKVALETIGPCPVCKNGNITLRTGKFGRFAACNKYPECKTTFNLPKSGKLEMTKKICEHCKHPIVKIIRRAKRPMNVCLSPECPSKIAEMPDVEGHKCPKCKEGDLIIRKSIYGAFIACKRFPKCFYTERIPKPDEKKSLKKEAKKKVAKRKKAPATRRRKL